MKWWSDVKQIMNGRVVFIPTYYIGILLKLLVTLYFPLGLIKNLLIYNTYLPTDQSTEVSRQRMSWRKRSWLMSLPVWKLICLVRQTGKPLGITLLWNRQSLSLITGVVVETGYRSHHLNQDIAAQIIYSNDRRRWWEGRARTVGGDLWELHTFLIIFIICLISFLRTRFILSSPKASRVFNKYMNNK